MTLDYRNPNDWGKSPLTDSALRLHQLLAETSLDIEPVNPDVEESFDYPTFTGTEFLATHSSIDEHPYAVAFGQFLGNGIDPDTANLLAHGQNRFDLISDDFDSPLRQRATRIYDRFVEMNYWPDDDESGHEPENFTWGEPLYVAH